MTTNEMKIAMADGDATAVPQENLYQQAVKNERNVHCAAGSVG
jgi:hypothetical protein